MKKSGHLKLFFILLQSRRVLWTFETIAIIAIISLSVKAFLSIQDDRGNVKNCNLHIAFIPRPKKKREA